MEPHILLLRATKHNLLHWEVSGETILQTKVLMMYHLQENVEEGINLLITEQQDLRIGLETSSLESNQRVHPHH